MQTTKYFGPGEFAKYLDERMAQHNRWQHKAEHVLIEEIIDEIRETPPRRPRSGHLFDLLPEHVQSSVVTDLERRQ